MRILVIFTDKVILSIKVVDELVSIIEYGRIYCTFAPIFENACKKLFKKVSRR